MSVAFAIAVVACNALVGFDDLKRGSERGGADAAGPEDHGERSDGATTAKDAPASDEAGGVRCRLDEPFGAPEVVTEFGGGDVGGAILSPDELEAFFYSSLGGGHLRHARRASEGASWSVADDPLTNSVPVSTSADGLRLYLVNASGNLVARVATRAAASDAFTVAQEVALNANTATSTFFVVDTRDTIYFARRIEAGDAVIAAAVLNGLAVGTDSTEIENIHAPGSDDTDPVLNRAETVMYFHSTRPGGSVWSARRPSKDVPFSPPAIVPTLDQSGDYVTWVSEDDCELYLDRGTSIFRVRRPP